MNPALIPWLINFIAIFGVFITEMATDIYLPAVNCIIGDLGTSRATLNMTLSSNLAGLALSAPFYGAFSDSFGRRRLLLVGLSIFTFGSLLCAYAQTGQQLILFRFVQGLGSGVAYGLGVAIQKDIYDGVRFAKARATMSLVLGFAPAIAPMIGGYLAYYITWNAIFLILALFGLAAVLLSFVFVAETHNPKNWVPFSFINMQDQFSHILQHQTFMTYALLAGIFGTVYWGFISSLTFLFLQKLGVTEIHYPYYQLPLVVSFILGTLINRILLQNHRGEKLLDMSMKFGLFFSIIYFVVTVIYPDHPVMLVIFMAPICVAMGFIFPNLGMLAMQAYPFARGYVASAYGSIELLAPAFGVQIMSWAYTEKAKSITACVLVLHIMALFIWNGHLRREKKFQHDASKDEYAT